MARAILSIARNTLFETIRQNVFGVVICLAAILIIGSPAFAMFTFMDSTKLVQDMGLATILLTGLLLGVLSATNVVSREIEGRTALTVLSKPVGRESFVIGKYLGLAGAITVAVYILTIVLLLTFRFGVKDTASTKLDWGIMYGIALSALASILIGFFLNYFMDRPFLQTFVWAGAGTLSLCLLFFLVFDKEYSFSGFGSDISGQLALAAGLILQAVLILVAVAVAASTRGKIALGMGACFAFFFAGLLSEYLFGSTAGESLPAALAYAVFPNLQVYWVTESMTAGQELPAAYVLSCGLYTAIYIAAMLFAAMALFAGRDVRE